MLWSFNHLCIPSFRLAMFTYRDTKVQIEGSLCPTGPSSVITWPAIRIEIFLVMMLAKSIKDGLLEKILDFEQI